MNGTMRRIVAAVVLGCAAGSGLAAAPSDAEQLWLEMINRFRAQPQAELDILTNYITPGSGTVFASPTSSDPGVAAAISFFGVNAATLRSQFNTLSAAPPLAWNSNLHAAAAGHTSAMIAAGQQSHQLPGEPSFGVRLTNAGYNFTSNNANENIFTFVDNVFHGHAAFLIDWGTGGIQNPPGHRNALINGALREIGISLQDSTHPNIGPLVVTQDIARRAGNAFLTGVAYTDLLTTDAFYTIGEGIGALTVNIFDAARTQVLSSTSTYASGGYSIQLAAGTYDVQFTGNGYDFYFDNYAFASGENQKLDFIAAQVPEPQTALLLMIGCAVVAAAIRRTRRTRHRSEVVGACQRRCEDRGTRRCASLTT